MNATLQSIKINEGVVPTTETPLWVGTSKVADSINGRLAIMSVSKDGEWLWVRFAIYPSEKYARLLKSAGFFWSKKRKAHHAPISKLAVDTLKKLGADTLDHYRLTGTIAPKPVEMAPEGFPMNVDLDAQIEHVDTPPAPKQPKADKVASPKQSEMVASMMAQMMEMMEMMKRKDEMIEKLLSKVAS